MSSTTKNPCARTFHFAGEERVFNLNDPAVISVIEGGHDLNNFALIMKFSSKPAFGSPAAALKRFINSEYTVADIENTIALGLVGGGMAVEDAFALVAEHVTGKPLAANALIASEVLAALFVGDTKEAA